MTHIGKLLKQSRTNARLTQANLSEAFGLLSSQSISNIERGLCGLAPKHYRKAAKLCKVPLNDFIEADVDDYKDDLVGRV